ncbi:TcaA 3rd/4th domain-containing protein [Priestia endophytica]|uniref:TcaA 3rd/4th domain-containing protein n=1 Tax=Priestia endophytica TaxID=135735 RepID=UPI00227DFF3C|nr:hypothetical protein [Priestia endophytica]MCY8232278.1 hypothetical protein [Priestia endophytica]
MKKKLVIIVPIAIIILILFLVIGKSPEPTQLVEDFQEKISSNDAKGLVDLVEVDEDVKWTEKEAKSAIAYLQDSSSTYEDQMMYLNSQAAHYESEGQAPNPLMADYPGDSISNIGAFYIEKEDGFLGDKYTLKARGYKLEVEAEKDATVKFNGKKVDMEGQDSKVLGVFGPGTYTLEGQKKFDYTTVKDSNEFTLFDDDDFEETESLTFSGETVTVSSDVPNTTLMINGEKEGEEFTRNTEFGPVKDGIKLQGIVKFPWGEGKSKEVTVDSNKQSYEITPDPIVNKKTKEDVKKTINEFAKNKINSLVQKDANKLTNVSDNIKKDYTETIGYYDEDTYFEGKALGTRIDFSKVEYEKGSGGVDLIHIPVEFHEKTRDVYSSIDTDLEEDFEESNVTLEYDEKKKSWIIYGVTGDHLTDEDYMTSKEVEKTEF